MGDPAGSFVAGVAELLRHPGTRREIEVSAPLEDLAISTAAVPAGADVGARLTLEAIRDDAITATGTVWAPWTGQCRRCLTAVSGEVTSTVQEVFEVRPVEGETYPLYGDHVDLEEMVRDAVLLALPLAPLCDEACPGPEPDAHPIGTAAAEPVVDPRWSALGELRFD
jgi:uncharacterized protein